MNIRLVCMGIGVMALASSAFAITERHVQGVITAVDPTTVTIQGKETVTARIDGKTRIHLDGKLARLADLKVTYVARGELNLDEAWTDIEATR
ncbi:MAG: hypothetical protein ABI183_21915 [Polyangiaceae bacterium]